MKVTEKVWDALRRKEVPLTPEERVRQWFIGILNSSCGVPMHMMMSEVSMKCLSGKHQRADIVVYSRSGSAAMAVECKRPEVPMGQDVADQVLRYNNVLGVKYLAITNGVSTFAFERVGEGYVPMESLPSWEDMA
jgi:hypothetical protein